MTKEILYLYVGTNGTILSPVHLEDIYYIRKIRLTADEGWCLTHDGKQKILSVLIPEEEVSEWREIPLVESH